MTDIPTSLPFGAEIDAEDVWCQVLTPVRGRAPRPALFLDRDGVVVQEANYLARPEDLHLVPGAADVVCRANALGVPVVVVTNQAGIGRGYYGWPDFIAVQERLLDELAALGAFVDAVFACPYAPEGPTRWVHPNHPARKPNPGMLTRALARLPIAASHSWIVGDRAGDIEAGRRAGIAGGLHVLSGHGRTAGERGAALDQASDDFRVLKAETIRDALDLLPSLQSPATTT